MVLAMNEPSLTPLCPVPRDLWLQEPRIALWMGNSYSDATVNDQFD